MNRCVETSTNRIIIHDKNGLGWRIDIETNRWFFLHGDIVGFIVSDFEGDDVEKSKEQQSVMWWVTHLDCLSG